MLVAAPHGVCVCGGNGCCERAWERAEEGVFDAFACGYGVYACVYVCVYVLDAGSVRIWGGASTA